jgi:hypothetical protein
MKIGCKTIKAEPVIQLERLILGIVVFGSYAWIERSICHVISDYTYISWVNATSL